VNEALCCRRLSVARPDRSGAKTTVLQSVDAVFAPGSVSLVHGVNGAGKSTLIHVLGGILRPSAGEVLWGGRPVSRWSAGHRDRWRRKVGIAFQDAIFLEDLTALENVMIPLIPPGLPVHRLRERASEALDSVGAADLAADPVSLLSGGQRQRVSFARAVVADPELLLADEPANQQDSEGLRRIENLLLAAAKRGATVVATGQPGDRLLAGHGAVRPYRIEDAMLRELP
jgi:ABC-type lipoprotein export system ATPase subunit